MKKQLLLIMFLFIALNTCLGQGRNNYWPLGYASYSPQTWAGGMKLEFPSNAAVLDTHSRPMWFVYTNAAICNDTGALQFYTNGVYIANALDDTMMNGSGINPSWYTTQFANTGLRLPQASIILPNQDSSNLYDLIHMTEDLPSPTFVPMFLYKTRINMSMDNGNGAVVLKNQIVLNDTLYRSALTAVKHGNGRDWWLLAPRWGTNMGYYTLLISPDSIQETNFQIFPFDGLQGGQSCFSPDGSKYIISYWWGVAFFDFDRCSGTLTFLENKVFPDSAFCLGASISPNSRYAYVTHGGFELLQYDLQAANIVATEQVVAVLDTFQAPAGWYLHFWMHQLAPDGKIYINTTSATMALHTIETPDSSGLACNVQQHSVLLPKFNATLPNLLNYNLGALTGSVCDTLTSLYQLPEHDFRVRIYPNPNDGNFMIGYRLPQNESGQITIYDIQGNLIQRKILSQWSSMHQINLPSPLSSGIYLIKLSSGNYTTSGKFNLIR